jgi:hypothetical protein
MIVMMNEWTTPLFAAAAFATIVILGLNFGPLL